MFSEFSSASKILWVQDQTAQQKEISSRKKTFRGGEPHTRAALVFSTQTYSQLIPCLETSCPTQALPTELWFNNPCISSDLQEQLVELQEELQRHNCGVNVPVPQLKWFMQHLVTMTSAITWLSSLNQSPKHYTEFVNQSKPQNAPDRYISLKIHVFIFPWEAVYHPCFGGEKLRKKIPLYSWLKHFYHSDGFKSLWDARGCLFSMNAKHHAKDHVLEQTALVQGCFRGLIWLQTYRKFCQIWLHAIMGMAENLGRFIQVRNCRFGRVNPETKALNKVRQFRLTLKHDS